MAMRLFEKTSLDQTRIDTSPILKAHQNPTLRLGPFTYQVMRIDITRAMKTQNPFDHQQAEKTLDKIHDRKIAPRLLWEQHWEIHPV